MGTSYRYSARYFVTRGSLAATRSLARLNCSACRRRTTAAAADSVAVPQVADPLGYDFELVFEQFLRRVHVYEQDAVAKQEHLCRSNDPHESRVAADAEDVFMERCRCRAICESVAESAQAPYLGNLGVPTAPCLPHWRVRRRAQGQEAQGRRAGRAPVRTRPGTSRSQPHRHGV